IQASYTITGDVNLAILIQYTPTGISNSPGSFVICDNRDGDNLPQPDTARFITISAIGRPHLGIDSNNDGIPENDVNANINSCTVSPFF
uniref:hypothetical protein n=1 Tax=Methyloglobulus sp. TaxID=2518622 RepID=UPI00398A420D